MYAELHCHTNYSFQEGASSTDELLVRAKELGYAALAITDHNNLCGAMEFAQTARDLTLHAIIGAEVTLQDGSHLTLLAETQQGYRNISKMLTYSYFDGGRQSPRLDPNRLANHTEGVILLTGCRQGKLSTLTASGFTSEAEAVLQKYKDCFGVGNIFVELQQNLVQGDTIRTKSLIRIAKKLSVNLVATNNVHYHTPERHRLQDVLVAIRHNKSLEETHHERRPNNNFYLKTPGEMVELFQDCPEAIKNTVHISERCQFDLTNQLGYQFPDYPVPKGQTPASYLKELCYQAAMRRYGSITKKIRTRLDRELWLVEKNNLSGFFLIYHDIIKLARDVMIDLGLSDRKTPLEENPPGRGRGSSVAMLIGYLIGLSHIDPLKFDLSLDRFLNTEMNGLVPDIDLDFPRNIRDELIKRVHHQWGKDHAVLTGMINTYKIRGVIRDVGKALGLPREDLNNLAKRFDWNLDGNLNSELRSFLNFNTQDRAPLWQNFVRLSEQLLGFPKYLAQHPGGMILSSSSLVNQVPTQPSAINGRYICQWNKDSIDAAGFVKIDFLALGALSQMQETLKLIETRTGHYIDLSQIDHNDMAVYESIHRADTIGIFQIESAAQMQTVTRIRPVNLTDMAYQVGAVRPGVGINDGIRQFIKRRAQKIIWDYDHHLEKNALERTFGVILFQDQVNQLAVDVAGFSLQKANKLRLTLNRKNNQALIERYKIDFMAGAANNQVPSAAAKKIFKKFNGQYIFPEAHAFAFGVTAYHMAWLKYYYPLEFFVALFNQQPMGFYNLETLKEDAKRHGVHILNPDINESMEKCVISSRPVFSPKMDNLASSDIRRKSENIKYRGGIFLGFLNVRGVGKAAAKIIVKARERGTQFENLADAMRRTGLQEKTIVNLVSSGTFDSMVTDRRTALWEVGLRYRPANQQQSLEFPIEPDMAHLPLFSDWETMADEYQTLGLYPAGHIMQKLRSKLGPKLTSSKEVSGMKEGANITVAGLVIRRQKPLATAVFITLEDEHGHIPIIVWPNVYKCYKSVLHDPIIKVNGIVSRREGTLSVVMDNAESIISTVCHTPQSHDWC